eukprot:5059500-Amphidinium_carterae.1
MLVGEAGVPNASRKSTPTRSESLSGSISGDSGQKFEWPCLGNPTRSDPWRTFRVYLLLLRQTALGGGDRMPFRRGLKGFWWAGSLPYTPNIFIHVGRSEECANEELVLDACAIGTP